MYQQLLSNIRNQVTRSIYHVELAVTPQPAPQPVVTVASQPGVAETTTNGNRAVPAAATGVKAPPKTLRTNQPTEGGGRTVVATQKVGRNEPCPCGSGKKYK